MEPTPPAGGGEDLPPTGPVESGSPESVVHEETAWIHQHPAPRAETGRPETGARLATRMRERSALGDPRTERGMGSTSTAIPENVIMSDIPAPAERETRRVAPVTYPHEE